MGSSSRLSRSIVGTALLAALAGAWAPRAGGETCPVPAPVLTGPSEIQAGKSYALSWTNVFTDPTASSLNYYAVERALDAGFTSGLDQTTTQRSAITLTPGAAGATVLYHRILVRSSCATASAVAIVSNVVAVPVKSTCDVPPSVGELSVSPPNPPAFSTWVIAWNTLGTGAGPGGGLTDLTFRIRETSAASPNATEWVVTGGASSFTGGPGDFVYQVRAEASCGSVGPWSPALHVTVGGVLSTALQLVSEPAPIAVLVPSAGAHPTTSFVVRNGGNDPILVRAKPDDSGFVIAPDSFTLAPNAVQTIGVTSLYVTALLRPVHASVVLTAGDSTLTVPIDCMITVAPSVAKVVWSDPAADIDKNGDPILRSILNPSDQAAAFVATIRAPWIAVVSLDGQQWDRPLSPGDSRTVQLVVDRAKRRSGTGTEVGAIALATVGFPDSPETLLVTDDGPPVAPAATGPGATPATAARTRLLYAAFPNAVDARSVGRFAADLWLTNTDVVNPVAVSLLFNPVGAPGDGSLLRRFDLSLAAGETRRYRNVVGTLLGVDGAFTAEVRSPAPTVTATVLVNNQPLPATVAAMNASRRTLAGTTPAAGQYGFELRPTIPGEGVKQSDPIHVVSGLAHDANRRSNLLLLETSGYDTTVTVALFDAAGDPVTKNGAAVQLEKTVPANGTMQINDADELFDGAPLPGAYAYAIITWKTSGSDALGATSGSVVAMATVIDNRTQDSSLHVGVSITALNPSYVSGSSLTASRRALASLPFGGGPAPLIFPTVHSVGAPLGSGARPFWRTRVTLTNTGTKATDQRQVVFEYLETNGTGEIRQATVTLSPKAVAHFEDVLEASGIGILPDQNTYGAIRIQATLNNDGSWATGWAGVDVQTETYTVDPAQGVGDFKTGMEGYAYFHGYSSFQSNLGTMSFDGAENSSAYRTNLILSEVGGDYCDVVVAAYLPGSFVPIASVTKTLPQYGYLSDELFHNILGLNLSELTDVRVVVRQVGGDGVFLAFASKIDLVSGDPANIFLRPAAAGTGR
ncbi:MAG: hypothetical protein ACHQJD_07130 [Thermoanaerobaculia bacterium]